MRRTVLILATAVLYGLSYPPYGAPWVAWVALVPLLLALRGLTAGRALLLAWISGLAMAYAITDFLPEAVAYYYGQGLPFGVLLFVASVSVMCCLSHMLFAVWYRWPGRTEGLPSPFVVGAAWVVAEFIRGDLEGNPWGTVGYTQTHWLPMVQIAEWTGVYGVSFVVVATNAALTDAIVRRASACSPSRSSRTAAGGWRRSTRRRPATCRSRWCRATSTSARGGGRSCTGRTSRATCVNRRTRRAAVR